MSRALPSRAVFQKDHFRQMVTFCRNLSWVIFRNSTVQKHENSCNCQSNSVCNVRHRAIKNTEIIGIFLSSFCGLYISGVNLLLMMSAAESGLPLDPADSGSKKWGDATLGGYQPVPHVLFFKQKELAIDSLDIVVLLNLTAHWWFRHRPPSVGTNVIARRTGLSVRTIQRAINTLRKKGYLTCRAWLDEIGQINRRIFLENLISKLEIMTSDDPTLEESEQFFRKDTVDLRDAKALLEELSR